MPYVLNIGAVFIIVKNINGESKNYFLDSPSPILEGSFQVTRIAGLEKPESVRLEPTG